MKMTLKSKHQQIPEVFSFEFEPETPVQWQAGQYMHYVLKHQNPDERGEERWFTISSAPFEKNICITTRFDGQIASSFKKALLAMEPGDKIQADGPKGSFVLREGQHRHIFIAGGIGITPYRAMLAQLAHDGKPTKIDLLYANRGDNFVFGDELKAIQKNYPALRLVEFIDKRIAEPDLQEYLADKTAVYYLSGPRSMVESYEGLLASKGVDKDAVMTDYFPGY